MSGVVCAIRGGPPSKSTLRRAIELAQARQLPLYLLYVVNFHFLMHTAHSRLTAIQEEMREMMELGMLTRTGMPHPTTGMHSGSHGHHNDRPMVHDDPNSILLEPGETKELIWTFDKAQSLQFACNVPDHYEAGMQGRIEIE